MKTKYILLSIATAVLMSGCNYLDIVPEERNTPEDTYKNPAAARGFLYSCYSKLPNSRKPEHIDKYSAGEVCFSMEKNDFQTFPRGYYSPVFLSITESYYNNIWEGIRRCYEFLDVIDLTPNMVEDDLKYYKAEATFLIAYYHFLALRAYGPVPIIKAPLDPTTDAGTYPERSSVDEVVEFIDKKIEEALPDMEGTEKGIKFRDCPRKGLKRKVRQVHRIGFGELLLWRLKYHIWSYEGPRSLRIGLMALQKAKERTYFSLA